MIKNRYFYLFIILILILIKYNYNGVLKKPVLSMSMAINEYYVGIINDLENIKNRYIGQKNTIVKLKKEIETAFFSICQ